MSKSLTKRGHGNLPVAPSTMLVPPWPRQCMVTSCEEETAIALLQVRDGKGSTLTGAAGTFLELGAHEKPIRDMEGNWQLKRDYVFLGWITRCSACYLREADQSGRSQLSPGRAMAAVEGRRRARAGGVEEAPA